MKKILTLLCLFASTSLMGQVFLSEADNALLEKLKVSRLFTSANATNIGGVGTAQMLSLRGITKVGKFWYFSIYDASLNSCFWVKLKDGDRELSLFKAEFFDDENKELEIATSSYTHVLALKERDPLTGPVPSILNASGSKSSSMSKGQAMGQMISSMNNEQKAAMAMHLAASMMQGGKGNMQGGNMQGNNNMQGNKSSGSYNKSSGSSSYGNKSSGSYNKSSSNSSSKSSSSKGSSSTKK